MIRRHRSHTARRTDYSRRLHKLREAVRREVGPIEEPAAVPAHSRLTWVRGEEVVDLGQVVEIRLPEKLAEFHRDGRQP
jgi:hypothetical protein